MKEKTSAPAIKEKIFHAVHTVSEKIVQFLRSSISFGELGYLALTYALLLLISYFLFSMNGFAISYYKTWPEISCIGNLYEICLFLLIGHFLCRRSPWYCWALVTIHFLVLFVLLAIYFTTGTFFCESILYLVYDTTVEETKGFFSAYVSAKSILYLLGIGLAYFVPMHFARKMYKPNQKYSRGDLWLVLILLLGCLPFLTGMVQKAAEKRQWDYPFETFWKSHPFSDIYLHIERFHKHAGQFTLEMRRRVPPDYVSLQPAVKENPPIGILVIGESAIRSHHSIYGYHRNTTPELLKEKANIIAFDDTIAVLPMTITALKYWLTDMTLENRHVKWTVFDALKKAGYEIHIITNQNKSGWADSPLQMIFSSADSITYMHEENYSNLDKERNRDVCDENIIEPLKKRMAASKKSKNPQLIVIHLFGSHEPFNSRYPQNYTQQFLCDNNFSALENEYDTSVHYSDFVIGTFLDELKKLNRASYLIYFSDHGSMCESKDLRTPASETNSAYEIPFLIWTNEKYRSAIPQTYGRMKKNRQVPLQADKAHYGLLEMMGLSFSKNVEKENFLSDQFERKPRTILEGERPYQK